MGIAGQAELIADVSGGPVTATDREISSAPCFSSIVAVNLAGREGLFFIAMNSKPA